MCICCILCVFVVSYVYLLYLMCICCILCVFVVSYVYLLYLMCICCTLMCVCCILCVFVVPYVYLLYYVCICCILCVFVVLLCVFVVLCVYWCSYFRCRTAGQQSVSGRSCATGHLDTGFSWFPCVYKRMLRWFPSFQVATSCLSCSPPHLNFLVTFFFSYLCTCKITTATG